MKTNAIAALVAMAACLVPVPADAASVVSHGAEARQRMGEDGCIIFCFADGWDGFSEARCRQLMGSQKVLSAASNAVLMPLAWPEQPDDARQQKQKELLGGLKVPGAPSYPAVVFLDKDGSHYATLTGKAVSSGSEEEVAAQIAERMEKGRERRRLLAQAAKLTTPERARLLFAAYQLEGLTWMDNGVKKAIRQADPNNETGVLSALDFNAYGFACNLGKQGIRQGMEEVDRMLENPAYTPRQKQQMCAAAIGMLRRQGSLAEADAMRRYARLMQTLVPGSPEGKAAARILRDWIPGLRYGNGWNPSCIPPEPAPVEMEGELPIREAGTYTVRFEYSFGRMALVVQGVELYDGKVKVAEDMHKGVAGNNHLQNVYTLTVPAEVKEPHLFITLGQSDADSNGKITISRQ